MTPSPASARRAFLLAALRLLSLFVLVFYGVDALTALRSTRLHLYAAWELAIPYWPAAFAVYFSVLAVPFLMLVIAPDAARIRRWERQMALAVACAGVVFVLLPAQLGYAPVAPASPAAQAWAWLAAHLAGTYNLVPSLHVGLALLTFLFVWPVAGRRVRWLLASWFLLLAASVLLTHQHHVLDVAGGVALALVLGPRRHPA